MEKKHIDGYKLVGVLNQYDIVPGFVLPVFERFDTKFVLVGKEGQPEFTDVYYVDEDYLSKIKPLNSFDVVVRDSEKDEYYLHDEAIMAFCEDDSFLSILTLDGMLEYLGNYNCTDISKYLKNQIEDSVQDIKERKGYVKKIN